MGRRSLLAREGEDNEVAEENFWDEMDKMCRKENINNAFENQLILYLARYLSTLSSMKIYAGVLWKTAGKSS